MLGRFKNLKGPRVPLRDAIDFSVLIAALILSALGLLMVLTVTGGVTTGGTITEVTGHFRQSLVGIMLGLLSMSIATFLPYRLLRGPFGLWICLGTLIFFLITPLIGLDTPSSPGVNRWLGIQGVFVFQSIDVARIGFILSLAWLISRLSVLGKYHVPRLSNSTWWWPLLLIGLCVITVLAQPDLGSAVILASIGLIIYLCSGLHRNHLIFLLVIVVSIGVLVAVIGLYVFNLAPYQMARIAAWQDPFNHDLGWQSVMAFISIALGGLTGLGPGSSVQIHGFAIEAHTDMIAAILVEELGVLTLLLVMAIYLWIAWRCFHTALRARHLYGALVCIGIGAFFLVQPFVNLGGVSLFIPLTGVPLPLISYGMTSAVSTFILLGLYFNVRRQVLIEHREL